MVKSISFSNFSLNEKKKNHYSQQLNEAVNTYSSSVTWQYLIPELGEGGTCSLFGELQDEPFDLSDYIDTNERNKECLTALTAIVRYVESLNVVDWFGIYQLRNIDNQSQLLKLSYFGNPSRPLFPVNKDYAKISNNTYVALNADGRVINNVESYVSSGGEYYTCDPKVKSEICLPITSLEGKTLGIIDAEAFNVDVFNDDVVALFAAVCDVLEPYLPE